MRDDEIVTLYLDRSEEAITETDKKYGRYLHTIAYNILANDEDSDESVSDTYLGAWNSIPPHIPEVLRTYLAKLTRRLSIDRFRHRRRIKRSSSEYELSLDELAECTGGGETPEDKLDIKLLGEAINAYIGTLSDEARNLFVGRYYYLDPLKKAASYCGMSESKAKSLLYRTRQGLRDYLKKEGFDV